MNPVTQVIALRHTEPFCQLPFALVFNRHELMTTPVQIPRRDSIFALSRSCMSRGLKSKLFSLLDINRRGRDPHVGQRSITRLHGIIDCQIMEGGRVAMVSHTAMTLTDPRSATLR